MPVVVKKTGEKKWSVVEVETGKVKKTYNNKADADAYATALNIAHARSKGAKIPKKK